MAEILAIYIFILLPVSHTASIFNSPSSSSKPVILISFDGFRWDYLYRLKALLNEQSHFWHLINNDNDNSTANKNGVVLNADGMPSRFATLTFPSHHTIATGLYQENHGLVANELFISELNRSVYVGDKHQDAKVMVKVFGGEPIYQTVKEQLGNDQVACHMWIGCSYFDLKNFAPYNKKTPWKDTVDQIVQWLHQGVKLIVVYHNEPDIAGHTFGPESKEMNDTLIEVDRNLGTLRQSLKQNELDSANLIIVSDHGMLTVNRSVVIPLRSDLYTVTTLHAASFWFVEPKIDMYQQTIEYLRNFSADVTIYPKSTLPEKWHYRENVRVGSIVLLAKPGVQIFPNEQAKRAILGAHGFDPDLVAEMRGIFLARGPAFKKRSIDFNLTRPAFTAVNVSNVDIYLLICKLLNLNPAPNNGSEHSVLALLDERFIVNPTQRIIVISVCATTILFIFLLAMLFCWSVRRRRRRALLSASLRFRAKDEEVQGSMRNTADQSTRRDTTTSALHEYVPLLSGAATTTGGTNVSSSSRSNSE